MATKRKTKRKLRKRKVSSVGALAANLHEGTRSEYLAQYIFASFGTAISVPHQEDAGIDLYCTMTERVGQRAWPRHHYTVQVKSTMSPWKFESKESVRWLIEHPLPLFFCVVDKSTARIRVYHTLSRFLVWATGHLPDSLELIPEDGKQGKCVEWTDGTKFSLSAPIIDRTISELLGDKVWSETRSVLELWLQEEQRNLARFTMRVPLYAMPATYETNTPKFKGGTVFQGSSLPQSLDGVRATLGEILPWLGTAYFYREDVRGMARAVLLLRFLFPEYKGSETPDTPTFVHTKINEALGLEMKYVHEGVDLLAQMLDGTLG
jgi:hypothetical protein